MFEIDGVGHDFICPFGVAFGHRFAAGLHLEGISKSFGATAVLSDIDLEVPNKAFVAFVGPSGCGKSTLLRLIAGLDTPSQGKIRIGGRDVTGLEPVDRGIAMVFQSYALYPHMSVYENLAYPLRAAKFDRETIDRKVRAAAASLQIEALLERKPGQLSGGQRQRVAIGRSIVRNPQVFLFDEPLSNLDAALRSEMRGELARLRQRLATTMIYVTHDQVEAMTLADQIVVLNKGRIEQVGAPLELYHRPATRFVASFIGQPAMNFISVKAVPSIEGGMGLETPASVTGPLALGPNSSITLGENYDLGIRPENLRLNAGGDGLPFTTDYIERLGGVAFVHGTLRDQTRICVSIQEDDLPSDTLPLTVSIHTNRTYLFAKDGKAVRLPDRI